MILVQPETVVRWHRAGFKLYWTWLSRHPIRPGRKCVSVELSFAQSRAPKRDVGDSVLYHSLPIGKPTNAIVDDRNRSVRQFINFMPGLLTI